MRRELFAMLLLAGLIAVSLWNIHTVEKLSGDISALIDSAEAAHLSGDTALGEQQLEKALQHWLGAKSYSHIFIRHAEIDSCTDAFYEAVKAIRSGESSEISPAFDMLRYHLQSISGMEHISIGNIF